MNKPHSRRWAPLALAALGFAPLAQAARSLDPARAEDALLLNRKMTCSLEDGKPIIHWWKGTMMSRVPGERDRVLFNVQGMNIRQCGSFKDAQRGPGFRSVSREVMLYLDPETNEIVRRWQNPWTSETVDVVHVANDPVNMRAPLYAYGADGKPLEFRGTFVKDKVWSSGEAPLWYDNPLAGDYQEYVGNNYHAMEMLNSYADAKALLDPKVKTLPSVSISWARVSNWIPWMKMGGREGLVVFTTVGKRVATMDDLSEPLRSEIRANYPQYLAPPPLEDARSNETSWTYIKKIIDKSRAGTAPVPAAAVAASNAAPAAARDPDELFKMQVRMSCSLIEGKETLYWWSGRMWARVPGEPHRLLFNVHGMNIRQCTTRTDPVRGFCYRSVSREVMFYLDPKTNEVVRRWRNPWSNEEVDVVQVANDPVNARDWFCTRDKDGKVIDRDGPFIKDELVLEGGGAARLFYKNPLAGEYQDYVGGAYHAMEFGSTAVPLKEALDPKDTEFNDAVLSWGRISRWLPWMKMGDRAGLVIFHTAGMRLDRYEQLPAVVRSEIEANYQSYRQPPPLDDKRPNETSWTVFKKYIDARRAQEAAGVGGK
jgi:hypothetical protein